MDKMMEMFEFVTDVEVLKELEHIFDDKGCKTLNAVRRKRRRKRANEEIKAMLGNVLKNVVKKEFKKRGFKDKFNEDEIQKINMIDDFLKSIIKCRESGAFSEIRNRFFFVCFKTTYIRRDGTKIECFYNKEINVEDLQYRKIEKYVAKAVYSLCQNRNIEVYFAVNSFKAVFDSGYFSVERKNQNILSSGCAFVDIDLPNEIQSLNLSDDELLGIIKTRFEQMTTNVKWTYAVKTGSGLHLYYALNESAYLETDEQKERYKELLRTLQITFKDIGSDINCIDCSRILRMPFSYNRKQKFGKEHREVRILEHNEVSYDVEELKNKLLFVQSGGMTQLFQDVLEDIFYYDNYEIQENDDNENYEMENDEYKACEIETGKEEIQNTTECNEKEEQIEGISKKSSSNSLNDFKYKGVQKHYDLSSETYYLCKDMKIWLLDRDLHIGVRHSLLFYFNYCWYVFNEITTFEGLLKRSLELNKIFKPALDEEEIIKLVEYNVGYMKSRKHNHKGIRHTKVQALLNFTNEEMKILKGSYGYTEEEIKQKRDDKNKARSKAYYYGKKQSSGKKIKSEEVKQQMEFIENNPLITYKEFYEKTGLSRASFNSYKRKLNINKGKRKDLLLEQWLNPFYENESITPSEYMEQLGCCQGCYYKYKKIFKNLSA